MTSAEIAAHTARGEALRVQLREDFIRQADDNETRADELEAEVMRLRDEAVRARSAAKALDASA